MSKLDKSKLSERLLAEMDDWELMHLFEATVVLTFDEDDIPDDVQDIAGVAEELRRDGDKIWVRVDTDDLALVSENRLVLRIESPVEYPGHRPDSKLDQELEYGGYEMEDV